jgi:hypothetical protein
MSQANWIRECAGVYRSREFGYEIWKDASEPGMWDLRWCGQYQSSFFSLKEAKQAAGLR